MSLDLYPLPSFGHMVICVEPGTVVTDDRTGNAETVTETNAVFRGNDIYVTEANYEKLKTMAALA